MANNSLKGVEIFPSNSEPFGVSFSEWTERWWRWVQIEPIPTNPVNDKTGENCGRNQNDTHVWFLGGTFGGSAERTCVIPSERAIFSPVLTTLCSDGIEPRLKAETDFRACTARGSENALVHASVDGMNLQNLDKSWVCSPLFDVTLPVNNFPGGPPGNTRQATCGYWFFLEPLSVGQHEIHFSGKNTHIAITGITTFENAVTYHLVVTNKTKS